LESVEGMKKRNNKKLFLYTQEVATQIATFFCLNYDLFDLCDLYDF